MLAVEEVYICSDCHREHGSVRTENGKFSFVLEIVFQKILNKQACLKLKLIKAAGICHNFSPVQDKLHYIGFKITIIILDTNSYGMPNGRILIVGTFRLQVSLGSQVY